MVLTDGEQMVLTPTYHVFEMYKVHQDATLLPMDLACEAYALDGEKIPAVSGTASLDGAGVVNLTLSNADPNHALEVKCAIRGRQVTGVSGRVLTASTVNAHNTFVEPEAVHPVPFAGVELEDHLLTIQLPAKSVVALALPAQSPIPDP